MSISNLSTDEVAWSVMNAAYNINKERGDSETAIYELDARNPNRVIGNDVLKAAQRAAVSTMPERRAAGGAADNAALRYDGHWILE